MPTNSILMYAHLNQIVPINMTTLYVFLIFSIFRLPFFSYLRDPSYGLINVNVSLLLVFTARGTPANIIGGRMYTDYLDSREYCVLQRIHFYFCGEINGKHATHSI